MKLTLFLLIFLFLLPSCTDKRLKNPEDQDLIYNDIQKDIQRIDNVIQLRDTEIEVVRGEMASLHIRSPEKLVKKKRIDFMSSDINRFKQLRKYLQIKLKKRKTYSRILYELHYTEKRPWPDKVEYAKYVSEKKTSFLPIEEINKADSSRELNHRKSIGKILRNHGLPDSE